MLGNDALYYCLRYLPFKTVIDIGSGQGRQANLFAFAGKEVTTLDASTHLGKPDILGDFNKIEKLGEYDLWWCCHMLEHQRNPGAFLDKLHSHMREGDYLAITVPPLKHEIVGGHVTLWNAGLLLYNLVLAKFDCRDAYILTYDYNISVVLKKRTIELPSLIMDNGDIERLKDFFPIPVHQGFDGRVTM